MMTEEIILFIIMCFLITIDTLIILKELERHFKELKELIKQKGEYVEK